MRQHLANAIFRAVENGRPLVRVTNSGISAYITPAGEVRNESGGFEKAVRTWTASRAHNQSTFYTRFGDVFAWLSALLSVSLVVLSFRTANKKLRG
jgi:apolipoprotein N-acyltransferase